MLYLETREIYIHMFKEYGQLIYTDIFYLSNFNLKELFFSILKKKNKKREKEKDGKRNKTSNADDAK